MPHDADPSVPDAPARARITADLDSTLFVDAGAGSGKTTALVDRVVALVRSGSAELDSIAAITFTDKAAAELRDRVHTELEVCAEQADETAEVEESRRLRRALEQLDGAAIGTLHAFAQHILSENPVEAGLPPRVEVLDEVSSDVAFEHRWSIFRDELLEDRHSARPLLMLDAAGIKFDALKCLAIAFNDNWDLVEERVPKEAPEPPNVGTLLEPVLDELYRLCATPSADPADKLRLRLDDIAEYGSRLRSLSESSEIDCLEALHPDARTRPSFKVGNLGKSQNFSDIADLKEGVATLGKALEEVRNKVGDACAERLASSLRRFTLDAALERRAAGQLEFHDLLVLARSLLCDLVYGAAVRTRLNARYKRLLLDEFQDTDPMQIELAVRIAARDPADAIVGAAPWNEVDVEPGRLFFVGDPKQSIYRFRRADISTFLAAQERFGHNCGGEVELTANFRTVKPVIDWVNDTFGRLMAEPPSGDVPVPPVPSQPDYLSLDATRTRPPTGPAVSVIGRQCHQARTKADAVRQSEAEEVAATVVQAVTDGWSVDAGEGTWRPARLGDISILVPARTSLPFLEDALEAAGVAFRTESSSLVYGTRAVRDLLMVLRAVDDPTNHLHIVSALRTPLLGCGDDELFTFKWERKGRWSYLARQPEGVPADDRVRMGLEYLRSLYDVRNWLAPSELLDKVSRDRRALELGFAEGRPRDVWRRIRFLIDQARSWSEATDGNLRQYLQWVKRQTAQGARVVESILPETDDDAVRIMTIHSAKGLEFPITIVSGMSTAPGGRAAPGEVVFPPTGGVGYRFGKNVRTEDWESWAPIEEQMGLHERIRLLYVACTRARDHLVVSLHRCAQKNPKQPHRRTNAELLVDGIAGHLDDIPDAAPGYVGGNIANVRPLPSKPVPPLALSFEAWSQERTEALLRASKPTTVSATALTEEGEPDVEGELDLVELAQEKDPGLDKRPRDLDLPPWLKGRYGTSVGRAVHGVLQTIDLRRGEGLEAAVSAQCEAEAVRGREEEVSRLVGFALQSPSVREAAPGKFWREVFVCTPVGERLLEGYVDLLYRTPEGLVVVDYKTSATDDREELERRVEAYRMQGASYALAVAATTGERVARVTFVFLTPKGYVELDLPDLDAAVANARRLATA